MKDWTILDKGHVPEHLGSVEYDWEWDSIIDTTYHTKIWTKCGWSSATIFLNLWRRPVARQFRFREVEIEPEPKQLPIAIAGEELKGGDIIYLKEGKAFKVKPKQPSNEELAECYINDDMGPLGLNLPHDLLRDASAAIQDNCEREVKFAYIAGREAATIPPASILITIEFWENLARSIKECLI